MYPIRINKFLTEAGYCSRRQADRLTEAGHVQINNRNAKLGDKVNEDDVVMVDQIQVEISTHKKMIYLMFNKPVGVIVTSDPNSRDNIIDYLACKDRIYPIGRLDVASSGLILLTNDGSIVNKILKAEARVEKEYIVDVNNDLTPEAIKGMQHGVELEDGKTLPARVKQLGSKRFMIAIVEGKNRQVRRMAEHFGFTVIRLSRVRVGGLELKNLRVGESRELTEDDIARIWEPVKEAPKRSKSVSKLPGSKLSGETPKRYTGANRSTTETVKRFGEDSKKTFGRGSKAKK